MKPTTYITTILFLLGSSFCFAQGGLKQKKEQLKTMKVAFITTEVGLTAGEAEKFWPIYNSFDEKQFQLRQRKLRAYQQRLNDGTVDKMTEKEAATFLAEIDGTEQELHELKRNFTTKLKGVISYVKILKLKKAEEDFNRKLLKQYRARAKK